MLRVPPPSAAPFSFSSEPILKLDGKQYDAPNHETLAATWEALGRTHPLFASFFASAFCVLKEPHLIDTLLCYGRVHSKGTKPVPGDMVCYRDDREKYGWFSGNWALATGTGQVLVPDVDNTWTLQPLPKYVTCVWRPSTQALLDPYSPIGRFYGPAAHRLREALSLPSLTIPSSGDLLAVCVAAERLPVHVQEFCEWAKDQLIPTPKDLPVGALVFHPKEGRVGIGIGQGLVMAEDIQDGRRWQLLTPTEARLPQCWIPRPTNA